MMRAALVAGLMYLAIVGAAYIGQRVLQYSPSHVSPGDPRAHGLTEMKEVTVRTEDGLELLAWFAPPRMTDGKIAVLFHGNAGHIGDRARKARAALDAGYGVYLCEYRGYGGNPGQPSEAGFYADARAGIAWLSAQGYAPARLVLYGESIGSGPAVQMATEYPAAGLILEGAFTRAADVARHRYPFLPVNLLLKDRYDNIDKIPRLRMPALFLHGDADTVVPYPFGRALFEAATQPKQFVSIPGGGHSNLYDFGAGKIITDWIGALP